MMNPQIALLEEAAGLLRDAAEAQAVLRHLEIKCPRIDGLYRWMSAACWAGFDFDSQALADEYRNILDPIEEYINPSTANEMKAANHVD